MSDGARRIGAAPRDVPILKVRHLSKTFGGARALSDVSFEVRANEIHGLVGENGSGKSTFIKILSGLHTPDVGAELLLNGNRVDTSVIRRGFRKLGLSFVHQDLGLIPSLSVLENLRLWEFSSSDRRGRISWRAERRHARTSLQRHALDLDLDLPVSALRQNERAMLALVRAITELELNPLAAAGRRLLVLDEPTAFLAQHQIEHLSAAIRDVSRAHGSVIFISHDLEEVRGLTDRVSVLRDGRMQGTVESAKARGGDIVRLMIGHELSARPKRRAGIPASGPSIPASRGRLASVGGVSGAGLREVSLHVGFGEVVGLTGLVGSGFEELPYLVFGATRAANGSLVLDGRDYDLQRMTPSRAVHLGMALIPANRRRDGSIGGLPVVDNVSLPVLSQYRPVRLERKRLAIDITRVLVRFQVRPPDPGSMYQSLSGGNQQKVMLAKWLQTNPRLILLHEPTQGVDVGAREELYQMLSDVARDGRGILWASADHGELATMCSRVLVFRRGEVIASLSGYELTKTTIARHCYRAHD